MSFPVNVLLILLTLAGCAAATPVTSGARNQHILAPCPSSGLIINGSHDRVAPPEDTQLLVEKLKTQKGIMITHQTIEGGNHFFTEHHDELIEECGTYLDKRLGIIEGGIEETMLLR